MGLIASLQSINIGVSLTSPYLGPKYTKQLHDQSHSILNISCHIHTQNTPIILLNYSIHLAHLFKSH